jgi:o-succinylbenzoate---CoA ligase
MHFSNYRTLTLNNKTYSHQEFTKLVSSHESQENLKELYSFLKEWLNNSETIAVNTSGSTGTPKTIWIKKDAMVASAFRTINFFELKPAMTALLCLPVSFIAGKMMVVRALVAQMNLIAVAPSNNPLVEVNFPIDFAAFTPMQMLNILNSKSNKTPLLQKVIIGGGKTDSHLNKLLQNQPFEAYETYGMTETLSHIALRRINGINQEIAFKPLDGVTINTDARGCLIIDAPEIHPELIITNDLAEIHPNNTFSITGRIDNVINSGGLKIIPEKIEEQIKHLIKEPFVISAITDKVLGQKTVLAIESNIQPCANLITIIKQAVHKHEHPQCVYLLSEFPRTESGKVKRNEIMNLIAKTNPAQ